MFVGLAGGFRKVLPDPPGATGVVIPVPVPAPDPSVGLPNRLPLGAEGALAPAPDPSAGFPKRLPLGAEGSPAAYQLTGFDRPPDGAVEAAVSGPTPAPVLVPGLGPKRFPPAGADGPDAPPEGAIGAVDAGGFGVANKFDVLALVLGGAGPDPIPPAEGLFRLTPTFTFGLGLGPPLALALGKKPKLPAAPALPEGVSPP